MNKKLEKEFDGKFNLDETEVSLHKELYGKQLIQAIIEEIHSMGFDDSSEAGQFRLHTDGYNQALEDITTLLKESINQ